MFGIIAIAVAGGIAGLMGIAATRPATFRIHRSTTIRARPESIVPLLQDFRQWPEWSPWEKLDADLGRKYSGAQTGVGSIYEWEGRKAGAGRMEILEAAPEKVSINLDFTKPFEAHNTTGFILTPAGDATELKWEMSGSNGFGAKLMSMFVNMDKLIGKDFEKGLAALKSAAEKAESLADATTPPE